MQVELSSMNLGNPKRRLSDKPGQHHITVNFDETVYPLYYLMVADQYVMTITVGLIVE